MAINSETENILSPRWIKWSRRFQGVALVVIFSTPSSNSQIRNSAWEKYEQFLLPTKEELQEIERLKSSRK
eukprot:gene8742-1125_t